MMFAAQGLVRSCAAARSRSSSAAAVSELASSCHAPASSIGAVRFLNVHEYLSMEIMKNHGIQTPECHVASTPEEAENLFQNALNNCLDQQHTFNRYPS